MFINICTIYVQYIVETSIFYKTYNIFRNLLHVLEDTNESIDLSEEKLATA